MADVSDLFNVLTGYSYKQSYCKLLSPDLMKTDYSHQRETEQHHEKKTATWPQDERARDLAHPGPIPRLPGGSEG
jgi:polyphosphate kinase